MFDALHWALSPTDHLSTPRNTDHLSTPRNTDHLSTPRNTDQLKTPRSDVKCRQNVHQEGNRIGLNEDIEIFSNSAQSWCFGRVMSIHENMATVNFLVPGSSQECSKTLPVDHKQLRKVRNVTQNFSGCSMTPRRNTYKVGEQVEVYSNSQNTWYPGYVEKINGSMLLLSFSVSDIRWAKKRLPCDHLDVRRAA